MKSSVSKMLIAFCLSCVALDAANIYSLYTDHRAMKTDDILTVMVMESAKAGSESGTNTSKSQDAGIQNVKGSGSLRLIPAFGASGSFGLGYKGQAGTSREGSLVATISARVIRVLENGNLMIEGSKVVEINEEKELIKVKGVVRPQDIEADNTIFSFNISDAEITYSGKGTVHNGHRPGLLSKLLNLIF
jgi:flagellar L-ring protein precursor FlgH